MARKQISRNKQMLKLLFKEVVELIDEEHLAKLIDGYFSGAENIVFVIGENSRGKGYKTAFSASKVPHSEWKLFTNQFEIEIRTELPGDFSGGSVN